MFVSVISMASCFTNFLFFDLVKARYALHFGPLLSLHDIDVAGIFANINN